MAILAYFFIRNLSAGGAGDAYANAERLIDLEEWLHIAWEDAFQSAVVGSDLLITLCNWAYIWLHWPVILATAVVLYLNRRDSYHLLRNGLFVSDAIGFLFFALFPVAPPRLLDLGLVDTVTEQSRSYRALACERPDGSPAADGRRLELHRPPVARGVTPWRRDVLSGGSHPYQSAHGGVPARPTSP